MSTMANGQFPYTGPAGLFWTEIDPDTGAVIIVPIQVTPPGGEFPTQGVADVHGDNTPAYADPPFNEELDLQFIESAIFDVKPEGFVQQWEGPWIPNTEYGVPMQIPLAGGHAAAVVFDPLSEYGQMRDPSSVPAHWEVDESPNEYWRMGQDMRFGGKPLGDANPQAVLYDDIQDQAPTDYQLSWRAFRNLGGGRHNVVVAIPQSGSNAANVAAVPNVTALSDLMPVTTDTY
jgi:hypothetical protein